MVPGELASSDYIDCDLREATAMSNEPASDGIPEVIPIPEPRHPRPVCPHCGSDDITKALKLGLTAQVGQVGIKYEATGRFLGMALLGTEPLHVDVCNACGTVTRIYVDIPERKWF
jgi:hypothetical protein